MSVFREIDKAEEWYGLVAGKSPFFSTAWEHILTDAFPYIHCRYFVYKDMYAVRVAQIDNRITTVPFSDGGDVIALTTQPLLLSQFQNDCKEFFGSAYTVRVHEGFCAVSDDDAIQHDLVDYRIKIPQFALSSVRKTLRHIISDALPEGASIRALNQHEVQDAHTLYVRTMRSVCAPALPFDFFISMKADMFGYFTNNVLCGVSIFLCSEDGAYYFISARNQSTQCVHAPHHLLAHAISKYQKKGISELYLGGARIGSSLQTFKEGWRGDMLRIFTISSTDHREKQRKSPARFFWRFLPLWLVPKTSKFIGKYVF